MWYQKFLFLTELYTSNYELFFVNFLKSSSVLAPVCGLLYLLGQIDLDSYLIRMLSESSTDHNFNLKPYRTVSTFFICYVNALVNCYVIQQEKLIRSAVNQEQNKSD